MKIYQPLLSLILIVISQCAKLNYEENQKRLKECGKQMLPTPEKSPQNIPFPENYWLVYVGLFKNQSVRANYTLGSFISPRHILTSSQSVLNDNGAWVSSNEAPKNEEYLERTGHLKVPGKPIKDEDLELKVVVVSSDKKKFISINQAWVLRLRDQKDAQRMRSPMLIELKEDVLDVQYPCFVENSTILEFGDFVHVYGLEPKDRLKVDYREINILGFSEPPRFILTSKYHIPNERGGPMVEQKNGKNGTVTLIGISASTASKPLPIWMQSANMTDDTEFFDMRQMTEDVCELSGICDPTVIWATTTTPATSTVARLTSREPSVPPALPESTRKPEEGYTDPDYDKIEGGEDEEEEEDFFVSADFLNGSGKMGLNLVLFAAVLAMVLVF